MSGALSATSIAQFAGMGLSAVSAFQGSQANKDAYGMQAAVSKRNAQVADWQAEDATRRGKVAASDQRIKNNQLKGTQRARLAANGVDLGHGSALQILADTDYFGDIDAGRIEDNAAREAWAIRQQAAGFRADASLLQARADSERPWLAAGTSLLTSAGRVAGNWYTPKPSPREEMREPYGADY